MSTFIHFSRYGLLSWYSTSPHEPHKNSFTWACTRLLEQRSLLHELAGHVEKAADATGRAARGTAAAAALEVHLESHLRSRADDVLLGRAAGSVAVGVLLVCDVVSCIDS